MRFQLWKTIPNPGGGRIPRGQDRSFQLQRECGGEEATDGGGESGEAEESGGYVETEEERTRRERETWGAGEREDSNQVGERNDRGKEKVRKTYSLINYFILLNSLG